MPSFDVVSELDKHQVSNAVDQSNRVVGNRFDFKGIDARFERKDSVVEVIAEAEFQVRQMVDMLTSELVNRKVDIKCMEVGDIVESGKTARCAVTLKEGIDSDNARKIVKMIKNEKLKVQAAVQGEQVRVTGKKRDDLQQVIAFLRQSDLDLPLQYQNFRD
ncbi:YajQ family cyclic di-GMP-binding protein [Oceanospirillum sediminis]|uniref:Nucleotide-binding protein H4O21_23225 n=1 Tax=Oceanospirillum sediminis TaxID=2760088 RepID=A0A839IVZ3_9GAMM|nr:YajQ family cyclic di-GMP-binding protein [Oceanospirillum sediminis]MBB1489525.1 YajQ family cyclic di-GMP-binding protein [Oceanospirillum sediminis]